MRMLSIVLMIGCGDSSIRRIGGPADPDLVTPTFGNPITTPGNGVETPPTTPGPEGCRTVTLDYTAEIATVANNPFGLDDQVRLQPVYGYLTYDTCVPDTDVFEAPEDGEFDHFGRGTGTFAFNLDSVGLQIRGSGDPVVRISNYDYFYFEDGRFDDRPMTVNGVARLDVEAFMAIGAGSVDFDTTDVLPLTFPMQGETAADFACDGGNPDDYCINWNVRDDGGTLLFTPLSLIQRF